MADQRRPLTDAELEVALRDLGQWLAYPPTPPLAATTRQRLAAAPAPRPGLWAAWAPIARRLALALLALALLASLILALSPDARWVVADRLGLRGVTIEFVPTVPTATPAPTVTATPTPAPTPTAALTPIPTPTAAPTPIPTPVGARLGLGQPVPLAEARQRASFPVLVPSLPTLGEPDEVYVTGGAPAPTVALLYRARPGLPVAAETGASLLLVQFTADLEEGFLGKGVGPETQLERLTLNGAPAFWVTGQPHSVFYLDRQGRARQETIRLAGNVLLWQRGALTLRLEGAMSREEALRIAASLR